MYLRVNVCLFLCIFLVNTSAKHERPNWTKSALVYQIYPRSFKDSNADGIGDLNGINEKLPHLKELRVNAIWMSPIFLSPMRDFGYDITDYRRVAPEYGTIEDFDKLLERANNLGIRLLLDFVPNHTSNESEWFTKSAQRDPKYQNYYVWADGKPDPHRPGKTEPPSNWMSVFGGSAWEWHEGRGQYYLHQFAVGQPDLNYRNPDVQEEMKNVLRFWLDKGVSGFRMDAVNFIYEVDPADFNGTYPDEPLIDDDKEIPSNYDRLEHIYSKDRNEVFDLLYSWRSVLDEYTEKTGEYKLMLTEAYANIDSLMKYYGDGTKNGGIPFNFIFLEGIRNDSTAGDIKSVIDKWLTKMPQNATANWVNGNHDQHRLASRLGEHRLDTMNMLALILPGITVTYQGEEFGMTNGEVSWEQTKDPQALNSHDITKSRDPERTPYQWDDTEHAGFSNTTGKTWLPVASNYKTLNLAAQKVATTSHYKFYKKVAEIKNFEAVRSGDSETVAYSHDVLIVARILSGHPAVVSIANLGDEEQAVDLSRVRRLPKHLQVATSGVYSTLSIGDKVDKTAVHMSEYSAVVLVSEENVTATHN